MGRNGGNDGGAIPRGIGADRVWKGLVWCLVCCLCMETEIRQKRRDARCELCESSSRGTGNLSPLVDSL
jgi:hypothetical protein